MQQRLLLLLEAATVEGKAGQRSASVLRSLGEVTSEVPFFNVPSTNAPRETLSNVVSLTSDGTDLSSSHFSDLKGNKDSKLLSMWLAIF
jgi:hypothetical protein